MLKLLVIQLESICACCFALLGMPSWDGGRRPTRGVGGGLWVDVGLRCWPILGLCPRCWPILGLGWAVLGLCWSVLGARWSHLGAMLARLEAMLAQHARKKRQKPNKKANKNKNAAKKPKTPCYGGIAPRFPPGSPQGRRPLWGKVGPVMGAMLAHVGGCCLCWAMLGRSGPYVAPVVYIEGNIHWFGGKKHNYGHLTVAELPPGTHDIHSLLNNKGVLPKDERKKAAECQTPSENCWQTWALSVHNLPQTTL